MKPDSSPSSKLTKSQRVQTELSRLTEIALVILLCPLYWTLTLFAVLTFFLPCFLLRFSIVQVCHLIHPSWTPMTLTDNMLGEDKITTKPDAIIIVLATIENAPTFDEFCQLYLNNVVKVKDPKRGKYLFPKYLQYVERWFGYNFWKWDEDFKIENHIRLHEGCRERKFTNEAQLMDLLGPLTNEGFQRLRSPWEIVVVDNYVTDEDGGPEPETKTVYIFRIHHGIGDGYSLLKTKLVHLFKEPLDNMVVPKFASPKTNFVYKLWTGFYTFASMPHGLLRQNLVDFDSNIWFKPEKELTRNSITTRSPKIPTEKVKLIMRQSKVSFNAVLYAALGGGIRKYLRKKYINDDKVEVPEFIRSFAPLPWKNHPNEKLVNHWTCAVVPILTGVSCPAERLQKMEEEFTRIKSSSAPLANYVSIPFANSPPVWFIRTFGRNSFSTAIVSIFPGPTKCVKFFGTSRLEDQSFWAPHLRGNAGIGIGICSYFGFFRICLTFDTAIIKERQHLDELVKYMEDELELMVNVSAKKTDTISSTDSDIYSIKNSPNGSSIRYKSNLNNNDYDHSPMAEVPQLGTTAIMQ